MYRKSHTTLAKLDELINAKATSNDEVNRLKQIKASVGTCSVEELGKRLVEFKVTSPETGNAISEPFPFNLMFSTQIGPTGKFQGFVDISLSSSFL